MSSLLGAFSILPFDYDAFGVRSLLRGEISIGRCRVLLLAVRESLPCRNLNGLGFHHRAIPNPERPKESEGYFFIRIRRPGDPAPGCSEEAERLLFHPPDIKRH